MAFLVLLLALSIAIGSFARPTLDTSSSSQKDPTHFQQGNTKHLQTDSDPSNGGNRTLSNLLPDIPNGPGALCGLKPDGSSEVCDLLDMPRMPESYQPTVPYTCTDESLKIDPSGHLKNFYECIDMSDHRVILDFDRWYTPDRIFTNATNPQSSFKDHPGRIERRDAPVGNQRLEIEWQDFLRAETEVQQGTKNATEFKLNLKVTPNLVERLLARGGPLLWNSISSMDDSFHGIMEATKFFALLEETQEKLSRRQLIVPFNLPKVVKEGDDVHKLQ